MDTNRTKGCLIDAHVHIYDCFNLAFFLDSALANFEAANKSINLFTDYTGILLLSETTKDHTYDRLQEYAEQDTAIATDDDSRWTFRCLDGEETSLFAERGTGQNLLIMAGRQIVTKEGLEVLALITTQSFSDGAGTEYVLRQIEESGAITVLPWGVGKWLGQRGRYVSELIRNKSLSGIFLGDNSGRPVLWQNPAHFREAARSGIRILPGTDPLPLPSESGRVGKFGFALQHEVSKFCPSKKLKIQLRETSSAILAYGSLEGSFRFLYNQIKIRLR